MPLSLLTNGKKSRRMGCALFAPARYQTQNSNFLLAEYGREFYTSGGTLVELSLLSSYFLNFSILSAFSSTTKLIPFIYNSNTMKILFHIFSDKFPAMTFFFGWSWVGGGELSFKNLFTVNTVSLINKLGGCNKVSPCSSLFNGGQISIP